MTGFRRFSFVPCLVLLTATAVAAQGRPASTDLNRGYLTGAAGASFGDQRAATFSLEIAERLNPRTEAYVAFNYFDNLFTDRATADLAELSGLLSSINGRPWIFTGRDRGLGFSGGAKYLLSRGPSVRPYVGGGPGVLNVSRTVTEQSLGDVSDPVLATFGAPDGFVDASKLSTFKPMAEFVAGVGLATGRTYVDVGYRFRKVFRSRESFTFSQFGVGVGMRF
jgi:opacity protein-like surface antigen